MKMTPIIGAVALVWVTGCAFFDWGESAVEPSYEVPRTYVVSKEDVTLEKALRLACAKNRWGVKEKDAGVLRLTRNHSGFQVIVDATFTASTCSFKWAGGNGIRPGDARYRRYLRELDAALRRECGETVDDGKPAGEPAK